jgi:hypothetical protein
MMVVVGRRAGLVRMAVMSHLLYPDKANLSPVLTEWTLHRSLRTGAHHERHHYQAGQQGCCQA